MTEQSFHICDANPTGGKAGKGHNKTSTVQIFDDTDPFCAFLVKMFRFNVNDTKSHEDAKRKAREWVNERLMSDSHPTPATRTGADDTIRKE